MMKTNSVTFERKKYKPFVIQNAFGHTMGNSLESYIDIKIHHLIRENEFFEIRVIGEHDRMCSVSRNEKNDKITNWQRPTAEICDQTLYLKCFPGQDYVKHYASLVASYLALKNRRFDHVTYSLPTDQECWDALQQVGLDRVPKSEMIVLGYGLPEIASTNDWKGNESILWARKKVGQKWVTYLIFQFSYWGDILRRVVKLLSEQGFNTAIFTAKVGAINEALIPNQDIVTGNNSLVNGEYIEWTNLFQLPEELIKNGNHVNSSSVMLEVPGWLQLMRNFDFVDSEIGEFAKGASESKMRFGYLHYISNSLSKQFVEDLSNERLKQVLEKRSEIKNRLRNLINSTIVNVS